MKRWLAVSIVPAVMVVAVLFGGCECHALERAPNAAAEERSVEQLLRDNAPPIPSSRAVGCDVCPGHCRYVDLDESLSMTQLMERYRRIAVQQQSNHADTWNALIRLACIAGRKGPEAEIEFLQMLYDAREPVRYYAASHALDLAFAIEEPVRVLREVADGTASFAAYAAARVVLWRQERDGTWPPNPHRLERRQRPHVQ